MLRLFEIVVPGFGISTILYVIPVAGGKYIDFVKVLETKTALNIHFVEKAEVPDPIPPVNNCS